MSFRQGILTKLNSTRFFVISSIQLCANSYPGYKSHVNMSTAKEDRDGQAEERLSEKIEKSFPPPS